MSVETEYVLFTQGNSPMSSYQNPQMYLDQLNERICVEEGNVRLLSREEVEGQGTLLISASKLIFCADVDLLIIGLCSEGPLGIQEHPPVSPKYPLGVCVKKYGKEHEPYESWLHTVIAGKRPKSVLLISECCGSYSSRHQEIIRNAFPGVVWIIPDVPDFCDNVGSLTHQRELAEALLVGGIVRPE